MEKELIEAMRNVKGDGQDDKRITGECREQTGAF